MGDLGAKSMPALGFLTVLDHAEHGLFGGYLVLNTSGRPIEFHCTAPIRPNRAQEILYGPTLQSFLYGEQIGQTLLRKGKVEPVFVCTDREPVLTVRQHVEMPVAMVLPGECGAPARDDGEFFRVDAAHERGPARPMSGPGGGDLVTFQLGRNHLAVPQGADADRTTIAQQLGSLAESFDLAEPFARIREAIAEAQQAV